ncbi:MAG TPA: glutaredoxin domain-containing protein [bacterium]|nr:glutaredoxin domain-containing protein [bacterium]
MSQPIIVYTTSWCGDCHRLTRQLDERGIAYEQRDIERDPADFKTMLSYTNGKRVIPTVDIGGKILINPRLSQVLETLGLPA